MNPRLESLLNRWIDGELAPPEADAVQRMLAEDPEARRACYELLMVDRLLDGRIEGEAQTGPMMDSIAGDMIRGRGIRRFNPVVLAAAALVAFALFAAFFFQSRRPGPAAHAGPLITGSPDSRMTIAQRQDRTRWAVGELLRLERGSADIRLNSAVSANFEGPAAIELLDGSGNVKLLEGKASFEVGAGRGAFDVHVPGGVLRDMEARFSTEVLSDGVAHVRVESGFIEARSRGGREPLYLRAGDAVRLEPDGKAQPIRLPDLHFRSGLPQEVALFRDGFAGEDGTSLVDHVPETGNSWSVLAELNPTTIRGGRLDTSSGARRLMANLAPHNPNGSRAVYIFTFRLLPPERIDDKIKRQDGYESISLVDADGKEILSIFAKAANSHRWQLLDEKSKAVTALTQVCSLWTHSLTLCYGLDGLATLHDGATAQAPIIAELRLAEPATVAGILLANRDGGDLAFSNIEANLLPAPVTDRQ